MNEKSRVQRARRALSDQGFTLKKSRAGNVHLDNSGEYMIIDIDTNMVAAGPRFDLLLSEVEGFVTD